MIIGIAVLWIIALENIYRDYKQKASANWIEQHKMKTGKLPPISDYLLDVVQNYTKGLPINKSIKVITPSAQFWNRLLPSQQDELLSIVSWLGEDTRDYIARMKAVSPPGQLNKIQLRWKR
ncbi:MAG: hypothetical protein HY667_00525 [Chloroflexi bacterium]|nr:hypothetical protein [Chloroflexota bacterium]